MGVPRGQGFLPFESSTVLGRCGLGSPTASLLCTQALLIFPAGRGQRILLLGCRGWGWGPLADNHGDGGLETSKRETWGVEAKLWGLGLDLSSF